MCIEPAGHREHFKINVIKMMGSDFLLSEQSWFLLLVRSSKPYNVPEQTSILTRPSL